MSKFIQTSIAAIGAFLIASVVYMPEQSLQSNHVLASLMVASGLILIVVGITSDIKE